MGKLTHAESATGWLADGHQATSQLLLRGGVPTMATLLFALVVALLAVTRIDAFAYRGHALRATVRRHGGVAALLAVVASDVPPAPSSTVDEGGDPAVTSSDHIDEVIDSLIGAADVLDGTNAVDSAVEEAAPAGAAMEPVAAAVVSTEPLKALQLQALDPALPDGTLYMMCSSCKAAYLVPGDGLKKRSVKVRCQVCDKTWFQTSERLLKTDSTHHLQAMSDDKIASVRSSLGQQWVRTKGIGIFVGNLPYTYEEKEIGDIFGEYGLTGISLVRDGDGQSKGFAFLEVSNMADADRMIAEMHQFHTDPQRRLTVRMVRGSCLCVCAWVRFVGDSRSCCVYV
jgi:hypothetical protein